MSRSLVRRVAVGIAATLAVVLVVGSIAAVLVSRGPLPTTSGSQTIVGLDAEVEIVRDDLGVPHIYASTTADLFFAQGFVQAQDRFFEMDLRRHTASGRLAELLGDVPGAVESDALVRTLGWRQVAQAEWQATTGQAREILTAYANGVNAYLEGRSPGSTALEYTLLDFRRDVEEIEPWHPVDSLTWLKSMAWDLGAGVDDELARAAAFGVVGEVALVDMLFPDYPWEEHPVIVGGLLSEELGVEQASAQSPALDGADTARVIEALAGAADALALAPSQIGEGEGIGSNAWAVAGEHTLSGSPILASDPHLSLKAPGPWHQVGLHCRDVGTACGFDVAGFSLSGHPGVVIGRTPDMAWGLATLGADVADLFLERVYPDHTHLRDGERVAMQVRTERIEVNGGEPVDIEVTVSDHGPLLQQVLSDLGSARDAPLPESPPGSGVRGYGVALAWTGLEPGRTSEGILALNAAVTPQDVSAAAELFDAPAQSVVFATADGSIGYQAAGRVPVRTGQSTSELGTPADGTWPRPGWDTSFDWQGWVPSQEMPAVTDPEAGYLIAANQAVTAPGERPFLGRDWDHGHRAARIHALIESALADGGDLTVVDVAGFQLDDADPAAAMLVPVLLDLDPPDDFTAQAIDLLREWDFDADVESPAAVYFATVWANLLAATFWDELSEGQRPDGGSRWIEVVRDLLDDPTNPWWDDATTVAVVETRDEILAEALVDARAQLTTMMGRDVSRWRWGNLHQAAPIHQALGEAEYPWPVHALLNPRAREVGGSSSSVNATGWDARNWDESGRFPTFGVATSPSMRMVVDLVDADAATWVSGMGVSGHPASPHYADQFEAWARGETFEWVFRPDPEGLDVLRLSPPG